MPRICAALILISFLSIAGAAQDKPKDPYAPVLDGLNDITVMPLTEWRAHAGDLAHGEDAALDDSAWTSVKQREDWKDPSRWIRRTIEVPERLNGYATAGAKLALDLYISSDDNVQLAVFANGSLIERTDENAQMPVVLTADARPGQKFVIAARIYGSNKTQIWRARLLLTPPDSRPDSGVVRKEILAAEPLIGAYEEGRGEREQLLKSAVEAINLDALKQSDQTAFDDSLRASQAQLDKLRPYYEHFKISAAGNSHIDMAWLWPESETVEVVRNTFSSALQMMREYPNLTFSMASAQTYAWMEEKYPNLFKEIQQRVKEGRWEIVGGMWVEPDLNMPDGESLARQLIIGKRYFRDRFGVDVTIGWNPDSFGYSWQLPQIYRHAGLDSFVTQKIYWNDTTKFPHKLFWWEAPDGSRLLTYFPHDYANSLEPVRMAKDLSAYAPNMWKYPSAKEAPDQSLDMLFLFGVGDHGGGPTRDDLDTGARWQRPDVAYPKIEFMNAGKYFANLRAHMDQLNLPTWKDELYFEYHRGVQTTQSETKHGNRKTEVLMLEAEKTAAIAMMLGRAYPSADFDTAWKKVLFNQFHDILPGSGIAVNYVDAARKYAEAQRFSRDVVRDSLLEIAAHVATHGTSVMVFNPLSWKRTDMVEVEAQLPSAMKSLTVLAPDGKALPSELLSNDAKTNRVRVRFLATDVPAVGYKVFQLSSAPVKTAKPVLKAGNDLLENEFIRVVVDPKSGCITSLFDKRSRTEALALPVAAPGAPAATPGGKPCGNLLQTFVDKPKDWDAWNIDANFVDKHWDLMQPEEVKLVESTPLKAVLRVRTKFQSSSFTQDLTLYAGVPRLDVRMSADWHEKHILLKVAFPVSVHTDTATYEIPFGSIERPTTRRTPEEKAKFEVPALRWADLSDAQHGLSLLNDSKYGYDARDNVMRLSLLRSPEWPDPHADEGRHEFAYSLYPHGRGWREAGTVFRGYELNYPLLTTVTTAHTGTLPAARSFFSVDQDNVIVTAIKRSDDDDSTIVRLYEWAGKDAQVTLHLPKLASGAEVVDFLERPESRLSLTGEGSVIVVPVKKFQIVTVKVTFDK